MIKIMTRKWKEIFLLSVFVVGCSSSETDEILSISPKGEEKRVVTMDRKPNRLINATSPYLKQHAYNPVDWYPWGHEALERARKEDKPILVSIGYSSCHWCHVMAHETFENEEIAELMNKYFICIKVDREERPDLDKIYMNFVQSVYGSGGWPLNVFLTPELVPFFGGTYFPPEDGMGRPGFRSVLLQMNDFYREKKEDIKHGKGDLAARLAALSSYEGSGEMLSGDIVEKVLEEVYGFMDLERGGFGRSNKFPQTPLLGFLLQHVKDNPKIEVAVRLTLDNMAGRGLYDHIGGGFHRYCTDPEWWVPHFEKMLYDNALIPAVYLKAYQLWGTPRYREVVEETLDFILRDMTHPDGGFFSAIDADSDGVEGKFYVWDRDELERVLGENVGKIVSQYYGVTPQGNFEGRKSVLNIDSTIHYLARKYEMPEDEILSIIRSARKKLLEARRRRTPPGLDNKILTAWNGMMIHTLAEAYRVLGDSRYLEAAIEAAGFIENNMERDGRYSRVPIQGPNILKGYLSDYAQMAKAYISLFEATNRAEYLNKAKKISSKALEYFWDEEKKGFFFTPHDHEQLFTKIKEATDGAVPSGNSVFAHNFLRLYAITADDSYRQIAADLMQGLGTIVNDNPVGAASWFAAYHFWWAGYQQLVLVGPRDGADIYRQINRKYLPNKVVLWLGPNGLDKSLAAHRGKKMLNNLPTLYICRNFSCLLPLNDIEQIITRLDSL